MPKFPQGDFCRFANINLLDETISDINLCTVVYTVTVCMYYY